MPSTRTPLVLLFIIAWLAVLPAYPQGYDLQPAPDIVSLDRERVFTDSIAGKRIQQEIEKRQNALRAENQLIDTQLTEEEKSLAEQRKIDLPDVFATKATAFDEKVKRIRQEQRDKGQKIVQFATASRTDFFKQVAEVLRSYMAQNGVNLVLEANTVMMSAQQADITQEVINRLDRQ